MKIRYSRPFYYRVTKLAFTMAIITFAAMAPSLAADLCRQSFLPDLQRAKLEIGLFTNVPAERQTQIGLIYREDLTRGGGSLAKPPTGAVRRVEREHLSLDLETMSPEALSRLRSEGSRNIKRLYVVTSGAGLWSRGAGQVKALVPFNLGKLLTAEQIQSLERLSGIATATKPEDVLAKAGVEPNGDTNVEAIAEKIVIDSKRQIEGILSKARNDRRALTPLDLKFVNVALSSSRAGTYIPFDIWTSEQTHGLIIDYVQQLMNGYQSKLFHSDANVDKAIKRAIGRYFAESDRRGETHVLGIQAGVKALDPKTGEAVTTSVAIGEGAGMLKHYLDGSGRTSELRAAGKDTLLFDNIEVVSDLETVFAAHLRTGKDVSVVLVPQKNGYSGGSPFLVQKADGKWNIELHEQSALPAELATGNAYFNSNTLVYSLGLRPPYELGYESKSDRGKKIIRVKMNAGDITKAASTGGIGGRIGIDYENFKSYQEFNTLGARLIDAYRSIWSALTAPCPPFPGSTSCGAQAMNLPAGPASAGRSLTRRTWRSPPRHAKILGRQITTPLLALRLSTRTSQSSSHEIRIIKMRNFTCTVALIIVALGSVTALASGGGHGPKVEPVKLEPATRYNGATPIDLKNGMTFNNGTYGLPNAEYESWSVAPTIAANVSSKTYPFEAKGRLVKNLGERIAFYDAVLVNWANTNKDMKPEALAYAKSATDAIVPKLATARKAFEALQGAGANDWSKSEREAREAFIELQSTYYSLHANAR